MPKVSLSPDKQQDEALRRLIRMAMAREGYTTQKALAKKMNCSEAILSYRLRNPDSFSRRELRHIRKILRISQEELAAVI